MFFRCIAVAGLLLSANFVVSHPGEHKQLDTVQRLIEASPADPSLYIRRGMVYSNIGDYDAALADYAKAETLDSEVIVAFERGVVYYRLGELARAAEMFTTYQKSFPQNPVAYEYQARIARDRGDYPAAVGYIEAFLQRHQNPNPGHYLSAAKMLAQMNRPDKALVMLDEAIAQLGPVSPLQRYAIELEVQGKRFDAALQRMDEMPEKLKLSPRWKMEKIDLLLQAGKPDKAEILMGELSSALLDARPTPANRDLQKRLAVLRETSLAD